MSVVVNIISAVIKSVVGDKIGNELVNEVIGISIDGVSEKGIDKINDFINGEKAKIEHILSKENMKSLSIPEENIDFVVAEIKDLLSEVEITDKVLRRCKYDSMNLSAFLWNEYCERNDYVDCESDIKKGLFAVSEALIRLVRESEDFKNNILEQISNTVDDIQLEQRNNFHNMRERLDRLEESNIAIYNKVSENLSTQDKNIGQIKVKSRTQEYADKWNENMFLNNFDKRDQNAGVNVKLSEVYLEEHLPYYKWRMNENVMSDLKGLLSEYITEFRQNQMLLILGQPGIGKSTLITWITANFTKNFRNILVYQFASDLKNIEWQSTSDSYDIVDEVLRVLNLSYDNLDNKTLIIDGFDEVNIGNDRDKILKMFYRKLIKDIRITNFSLIITCRENYLQNLFGIGCDYITLQPWNEYQIKSFCNVFQNFSKQQILDCTITNILRNKSVLGIPLILYMVLALNISIDKEGSIVDVYDQIFSLDGGIYDRCINYMDYAELHRIGKIKKEIHKISRGIAIWMFENNPVSVYISKEEYQKICMTVINERNQKYGDIQRDFMIGNYFKLVNHCEGIGTAKLYFVHRSIYEYFVAETIYSSIENASKELTEESQKEFAKKIVIYLKQGLITNTIGEYLQFKLLKLYNGLDDEKREHFYQWCEEAIEKMMDNGMFFYTGGNIKDYKSIIDKEIQCFYNLVKILRLLQKTSKRRYILENADKHHLEKYIRFSLVMCRMEEQYGAEVFNLSEISLVGINFSGVDFTCANLNTANLSGANLSEAYFRSMYLQRTNFRGADLSNANLIGANLVETDLEEADLQGADLREALFNESQIKYLKDKYDLQGSFVKIVEENKVVSYEEYCAEYQ